MNDEKKKDSKIVPFQTEEELLTDPEIDQMVKESLMQEADELEELLERDPKLAGVGASDDLFQVIVGKLKEQNLWEEDGGAAPSEKPESTAADTEKISAQEKSGAGELEAQEIQEIQGSAAAKKSLEELYALLPEEDRRAMELGRNLEKKRQQRAARRKKRGRLLRYGGASAALLAVVFGISMTSKANRRLVLKVWNVVAMNFNFHMQTDYSGEEEQVRSKSREEAAAMKEISESLGVPCISLEDLPEGMEYNSYDIVTDTAEAVLFYTYRDTFFSVTIVNFDAEGSTYYVMDERTDLVEEITTEQYFEAQIWETNLDMGEENRTYIAEINHENCRYILNGKLSLEEMEIIVKNAYIL